MYNLNQIIEVIEQILNQVKGFVSGLTVFNLALTTITTGRVVLQHNMIRTIAKLPASKRCGTLNDSNCHK